MAEREDLREAQARWKRTGRYWLIALSVWVALSVGYLHIVETDNHPTTTEGSNHE